MQVDKVKAPFRGAPLQRKARARTPRLPPPRPRRGGRFGRHSECIVRRLCLLCFDLIRRSRFHIVLSNMSQVYSTEPATTGRVVIETTLGPIDVNLWCKECPTTCRTFLQLCLDGYYDGMIFHRILSEFLIQTGLTHNASMAAVPSSKMDTYLKQSTAVPTNYREASMTGDLLGWERKKLEVNPRIRFNHRGQVAAAFPLEESSETKDEESSIMLRYQFFV